MTPTTTIRRLDSVGGNRTPRHVAFKVLRGASWKMGWLLVSHGLVGTGDRLMPYPTGGFNNTLTPANGGPLQIAGADANGGIRAIAKVPNLGYAQTVSGAGALTVSILYSATGFAIAVLVQAPAATTASAICVAIQSSEARDLIETTFTGGGAGVAVTSSTSPYATVPYVRIAGIAGGEADNTADVVNDNPLVLGCNPEQVYMGRLGLLWDGVIAIQAPQKVWAIDNQTVAATYTPMCLPIWCSSFDDDRCVCEIK